MAGMAKRQALRAVEHGRPERAEMPGRLPGKASELFGCKRVGNARKEAPERGSDNLDALDKVSLR